MFNVFNWKHAVGSRSEQSSHNIHIESDTYEVNHKERSEPLKQDQRNQKPHLFCSKHFISMLKPRV